MSVLQDHVPILQSYWAVEFTDTGTSVVVKRETGSSFNETTGQTEPTFTTQYSGAAVAMREELGAEDYGETQAEIRRYRVFIPYDEADPRPGDLVDITSTEDAYLNGRTVAVRNVVAQTFHVVRGLICEENQSA